MVSAPARAAGERTRALEQDDGDAVNRLTQAVAGAFPTSAPVSATRRADLPEIGTEWFARRMHGGMQADGRRPESGWGPVSLRHSARLALLLACVLLWLVPGISSARADGAPDRLLGWSPPDGGGSAWALTGEELGEQLRRETCADPTRRVWERPERGLVGLAWNVCAEPALAAELFGFREQRSTAMDEQRPGVLPGGVDRSRVVFAGEGVMRYWSEDTVFVSLVVGCAGPVGEACRDRSAELARQVSALLDGDPLPAEDPFDAGDVVQRVITLPIAFWLVVLGLPRLVTSLRRSRYPSRSAPGYDDLTAVVRGLRGRRAGRRICLAVAVLLALSSIAAITDGEPTLGVLPALGAAGLLYARRKLGHPLLRRPGAASPVGRGKRITAALFGAVATALCLAVLTLYVPFAVLSDVVALVPDWENYVDPSVADIPLAIPFLAFLDATRGAPELFLFLIVLPAVLLAFGADRLARRFLSLSARDVVAHDPRPFFLYLRSFDEDRLKLRVSLGRTGILELLAPLRRRRFEEVLVRALSAHGPVIAISPPGQRLPALGAARTSVDHDQWQGQVEDWARQARAVVLSGTPDSIREGFRWEIDMVADSTGHRRIVVVFGPWRLQEFRRRVTAFLGFASQRPLFGALPWGTQDGSHVSTHDDQHGWRSYGAQRRSDWSYAVCIGRALERAGSTWDTSPVPPPRSDPAPGSQRAGVLQDRSVRSEGAVHQPAAHPAPPAEPAGAQQHGLTSD